MVTQLFSLVKQIEKDNVNIYGHICQKRYLS